MNKNTGGIRIVKRSLTEGEIEVLTEVIHAAPDIVYVAPYRWRDLSVCYVVECAGEFAGVCGLSDCREWVKVGPLVVKPLHRGKGLGRALLTYVVHDNQKKGMLILSSNPAVQHVVVNIGFVPTSNPLKIPPYVIAHLFIQLVKYISDNNFLYEWFRKRKTHAKSPIVFYTYIP